MTIAHLRCIPPARNGLLYALPSEPGARCDVRVGAEQHIHAFISRLIGREPTRGRRRNGRDAMDGLGMECGRGAMEGWVKGGEHTESIEAPRRGSTALGIQERVIGGHIEDVAAGLA